MHCTRGDWIFQTCRSWFPSTFTSWSLYMSEHSSLPLWKHCLHSYPHLLPSDVSPWLRLTSSPTSLVSSRCGEHRNGNVCMSVCVYVGGWVSPITFTTRKCTTQCWLLHNSCTFMHFVCFGWVIYMYYNTLIPNTCVRPLSTGFHIQFEASLYPPPWVGTFFIPLVFE